MIKSREQEASDSIVRSIDRLATSLESLVERYQALNDALAAARDDANRLAEAAREWEVFVADDGFNSIRQVSGRDERLREALRLHDQLVAEGD